MGKYLLMHAVIYRTALLRSCWLTLPKHTFYVDDLYVYVPLRDVQKLYYPDVNFYHYYIGREEQSVQEQVMIRRIDQYLLVNRLMVFSVDPFAADHAQKQKYMLNFLEIITTVSSVLLVKSGTEENLQKKKGLWAFIEKENPRVYKALRHRLLGRLVNLPGRLGRAAMVSGYKISQKIFGFN